MGKIAFFVQHMICGGVENALIALSSRLVRMGNDVTIYVIAEKGEFMRKIPTQVRSEKIPMPEEVREKIPVGGTRISIRDSISRHRYVKAMGLLISHLADLSGFAELNVDFERIPRLNEGYDIAVDYHIHSPFLVRYLSEKVTAKKKLSWIHNDFSTTGYEIKSLQEFLGCCDAFYGVSQKVVDEFVDIFPEYRDKTYVAHNIVPRDEILQKGGEYIPEEYERIPEDHLKLLSVGRLEKQKGYDIAGEVCRKLIRQGLRFQWFILGEGAERDELEKRRRQMGLADTLYFLGTRMNPYPYFKGCDIYVQTSRHEGYVTTVTEAKVFNKPIVCTDFAGAREQIIDGVTGDIAGINVESVREKLSRLMMEDGRRAAYTKALSQRTEGTDLGWIEVFRT